jgi:hypothetical protein
MNKPISFRDVEKLSAFLDGQLPGPERRALEVRLASDPELASVMEAMRQSRALLRKLPQRRAPRNFTLSPQRVSKKPPLPRAYPALQWATGLASLIFILSLAIGTLGPVASTMRMASAPRGMGGGGAETAAATEAALMAPPEVYATEAPAEEYATEAATESAADATTQFSAPTGTAPAPAATGGMAQYQPMATATSAPEENYASKIAPTEPSAAYFANSAPTEPAVPEREAAAPNGWLIGPGIAILLGLAGLFGMRWAAVRKWRQKTR